MEKVSFNYWNFRNSNSFKFEEYKCIKPALTFRHVIKRRQVHYAVFFRKLQAKEENQRKIGRLEDIFEASKCATSK